MDQFQRAAEQEIDKSSSAAEQSNNENPQSDVDIRVYGRLAPFLMRKAAENSLDTSELDYKYRETVEMLQGEGLIDVQGNITDKGQAAWESYTNKKAERKNKPVNRDAMDDLADMGNQSDAVDDLADLG